MPQILQEIKTSIINNKKQILVFALISFALLVFVEPAYAGPGGFVAKGLFKSWWGKVFLFALVIILSPLIIYINLREYIAVKQNEKILTNLASVNSDFKWSSLQKNIRNVYLRVHVAWSKENMEEVSSYVSNWYWQNQQLVILDEWKRKKIKNICHLKEIIKVKPLHLEITDENNLEGSRIAFSITSNIEDYLINRGTGKVVYGKKGYQEEEKIWFLEYTNGKWLLDEIRESNISLSLAKLKNIVPEKVTLAMNKK